MTARLLRWLAGPLLWPVVLTVLLLAAAGFTSAGSARASGGTSADTSAGSASSRSPRAARGDAVAPADGAVRAAVRFQQAQCSWDWRRPLRAYLAGQQEVATPGYARRLSAAADGASWRREVIGQRQHVSCAISGAQRLVGAPTTSATVYVRMSLAEHVTSTRGSFEVGTRVASWRVELQGGRWLVAGSFVGG